MRYCIPLLLSVAVCACTSVAPREPVESMQGGNYRISDDSDDAVNLGQALEGDARRFCSERGGAFQLVDREQRTVYRSMEGYHRITLIFRCGSATRTRSYITGVG